MADVFSPEKRSEVMSKITSKNTGPEVRLRHALHNFGLRYRLHDKRLPGTPDIVLRRYNAAIQVRGCFWHQHNCKNGHIPKSRQDYWIEKLQKNVERDRKNDEELKKLGWRLWVVWECEISSKTKLGVVAERIYQEIKRDSV